MAAPISSRSVLVQRWLLLTHEIMPEMADKQKWPISSNHCFMRVCLGESIGGPWHLTVRKPALRHLTDEQLKKAVTIAEQIIATPSLLFVLNSRSIEGRKAKRK